MTEFSIIYNLVKELYPLYNSKHKEWFSKSYDICQDMLKQHDDELSEMFVMQYFINNFNEEHTYINIDIPYFTTLKYSIFTYYNGDILYVTHSTDNNIPVGSHIIKIDSYDVLDYINKFMMFYGGIQNDLMDIKYQSNFIFIDHRNKFLPSPKTITLDTGKVIKLKYNILKRNTNILEYFTYDMLDQSYDIYKKNETIYIKIPNFDDIDYSDLEVLLPCEAIEIDLRYNLGGLIINVERFFEVVYNIDLKLSYNIHLNKLTVNKDEIEKLKKIKGVNNIKEYINEDITSPKLTIYINEYSKSSSKLFAKTAKTILPSCTTVQIEGDNDLNCLCGSSITISTPYYLLNIPSVCYNVTT